MRALITESMMSLLSATLPWSLLPSPPPPSAPPSIMYTRLTSGTCASFPWLDTIRDDTACVNAANDLAISRASSCTQIDDKNSQNLFDGCTVVMTTGKIFCGTNTSLYSVRRPQCSIDQPCVCSAGLPSPSQGATRFAILGDYTNSPTSFAVAALVAKWDPEFVVTTGDNRYGNDHYSHSVGRLYHRFTQSNAFLPALGNHDHDDGDQTDGFAAYFGMARRKLFYHTQRGRVCFFVLDSTSALRKPASLSEQYEWLETTLLDSKHSCPWRLVVLHHSPFSSSAMYGSNIMLQWPFERWGAHAVLSSHSHVYERIHRGQVLYLVNGLGGYSRHLFSTTQPVVEGSVVRFFDEFGFVAVDATNTTLSFRFVPVQGSFTDEFTLHADNYSLRFPPAPPPAPQWVDCSTRPQICGGGSGSVKNTCLRWSYCLDPPYDLLYDDECEEADDECAQCVAFASCLSMQVAFAILWTSPPQVKLKLLALICVLALLIGSLVSFWHTFGRWFGGRRRRQAFMPLRRASPSACTWRSKMEGNN